MKWLELKLDTSPAGLDPVSQLLEEQGITGLVIDDEGDFRDFLEHNHQYWDYVDEELMQEKQGLCRITFYLSDDPEGYHRLAQVRMALSQLKAAHPEYAPLLLTMNNLEDADWENNWKQFYKPMEIGERLIVVPEWEQANTQGRIPLILNPGLTFGTGSHATTRLCLTALEETIHGGERVLDLGCGSGILSIAALRLGAEHAFACDIDEKCVEVAYENAALNGIDLVKCIYQRDADAKIVFVTSHGDKGMDILKSGIRAFGFVEKTPDTGRMVAEYVKYLQMAAPEASPSETVPRLTLPLGIDETVELSIPDIAYVDSVKSVAHTICYHTFDGSAITVRDTIEHAKELLGEDFIRCHRSVLINRRHAVSVTKGLVRLSNGETVACALSKRKEITALCFSNEKGGRL